MNYTCLQPEGGSVIAGESVQEVRQQDDDVYHVQGGIALCCHRTVADKCDVMGAMV
jgi:hypothetical protein